LVAGKHVSCKTRTYFKFVEVLNWHEETPLSYLYCDEKFTIRLKKARGLSSAVSGILFDNVCKSRSLICIF
jgi:hypothetical protein